MKMGVFSLPFSNNSSFGRIWKVFAGNYKIHSENMVLLSQFPSNIVRIVTNERKKQHITQVRFRCHDFQIVFDLNDDINNDNVMLLPYLIVHTSPINCNVIPILILLIQKGPCPKHTFGSHNHLILNGDCCESIVITKGSQKVDDSPKVTTLAIVLVANKTFLSHELFGFLRTPNSSKNSNVSPSRGQQKREESGHAP
jgi:hypothetical protein